ncbi:MAG: hypothetical protein NTV64_00320 [Polaromonas sp.]|nr:hypothetical protein [Polaromonas sp.]
MLNGTPYGEASIKQVLMMASGGIRGSAANSGSPKNAGFGNPADPFICASNLNQLRKFKAKQPKEDGTYVNAGEEFSYKNLDTQSLAFLFSARG